MRKQCWKCNKWFPTARERLVHERLCKPKPSKFICRRRDKKPLTVEERRKQLLHERKEIEDAVAKTAAANEILSAERCSLSSALQRLMTEEELLHRKVVKKQDRCLRREVYGPKPAPNPGYDTESMESLFKDLLARRDEYDVYLAEKYAEGDAELMSPRYLKT